MGRSPFAAVKYLLMIPLFLALQGSLRAEGVPVWPADLAADRKELLEKSLEFLKRNPSVPYLAGGADFRGMDCSGAITCLLGLVGIELPRSAQGQYLSLKQRGSITVVPATARSAEDPVFRALQPGDLVFWAHDDPGSTAEIRASHVHLYLGREADGHPVMMGSSEGRSYRGVVINGFGITDFRVPKPGSSTRIVGFGPPFSHRKSGNIRPLEKAGTDPKPEP